MYKDPYARFNRHFKDNLVPCKSYTYLEVTIKRTLDIVFGMVGVFLFLSALVCLAPFYWFAPKKDKGPILYTQTRYGHHGRKFKILKFRTMIVNSQSYFTEHPDIYDQYRANGNKLENDPRVTKIGKFIRSKSLDELPQFINVVRGDMSLVGPRPILKFEIKEYGPKIKYLWFTKPGITGHWTTHGRSKILFPERADLELVYNHKHSLSYDIKCLFMTVQQIIFGSDAY